MRLHLLRIILFSQWRRKLASTMRKRNPIGIGPMLNAISKQSKPTARAPFGI